MEWIQADRLDLGVDREKILTMTADRRSWYKTVKRQIEEAEADAVRAFKNEYDLQGVKLEPDTKRYYPYASLASHVIGFVGADNTGLSGLEFTQNELLTGTAGSILRLKNSAGTDMILTSYEDYVDAQDGLNLHLTIDTTVQYYLEKQLSQAVQDFDIQNGAAGIIMDPNTGAILAMASLGNFDLNNYQRVSADIQSEIDSTADPDTAAQMLKDAQLAQWRNKAISDTYEPGSTFKIITLAIALEEGVAAPSDSFYCGGSMTVQGRGKPLKCWKTIGHGPQTLTQAAQHSCNVAFATLGLRIGEETFYRYCESFGFFRASENPVPADKKVDAIASIIRAQQLDRVICFCNTKGSTERLTKFLQLRGLDAQCIHGDIPQRKREEVMARFRDGQLHVFVATDVASRGIDVDDVDAVFNFEVPEENEYYIHRIGRTGRAKRHGVAYTLLSDFPSRMRLDDIARNTRSQIIPATLEEDGRVTPAEPKSK